MILSQKVAGSISNSLMRRQEEMKWCTGELDSGTPFVRVFPAVYVSGETEQEAWAAAMLAGWAPADAESLFG